ncbi:MAG TPA: hypothetical protein HA306_01625 [Methanosarcina sp.]|nr:hypothetical protein [Methanosarcina sp.]
MKIKSLNSASLAKVPGLTYLILAVIFSPFIHFMANVEGQTGLTESLIIILAVILFYGIAGVIGGFLIGVIYNLIAKKFGGIEIEFETT